MIDIIKNIFAQSGFKRQNSGSFYLFSFENKISYWIVKEVDKLDFLKEQDELFNSAKALAEHVPTFDKNTSLLLLYKCTEESDLKKLKNQVLEIEEDPYQFKKQVLIYTENTKTELIKMLSDRDFKELLADQETFKDYKDNYSEYSWHALLYRIAQKMPFIEIEVEKNKNLASLFKTNQTAITKKKLDAINSLVSDGFANKSVTDIKNMDPKEVFELLLTEEEKGNGLEN